MLEKNAKIIVLLAVAVSSPAAIFSRLCTAPSMIMAMYRMLFTSLILLPVVLWKHREELKGIGVKNLLLCLLSGFFLGIHFTTYFESMKHTTIAAGTVLADTEVLFVAIALLLLFREKIPKAGLIGIALTFCGSIIIALGDNSVGSNVLIGDLLALAAAVASSVYTLVGRGQRKFISTTLYTFLVYASACVTLFLLSLVSGQTFTGYSLSDYGWILAMTIFSTLLGHSIFSWALKFASAAFVSTAKLAEPVFSAIMAVVLFSEVPKLNQIGGGVIVLAGILLYLRTKDSVANSIPNSVPTKQS
ncbi:MAG: DMT family transporter [Butyricicoccus sp.]